MLIASSSAETIAGSVAAAAAGQKLAGSIGGNPTRETGERVDHCAFPLFLFQRVPINMRDYRWASAWGRRAGEGLFSAARRLWQSRACYPSTRDEGTRFAIISLHVQASSPSLSRVLCLYLNHLPRRLFFSILPLDHLVVVVYQMLPVLLLILSNPQLCLTDISRPRLLLHYIWRLSRPL